jgi:hypothetical protein
MNIRCGFEAFAYCALGPNHQGSQVSNMPLLVQCLDDSCAIPPADLGPSFAQQQARALEMQSKSSASSSSGSTYPANYFLDEKYKRLFAEGNAESGEFRNEPLLVPPSTANTADHQLPGR